MDFIGKVNNSMLEAQLEKGQITHEDIETLRRFQNGWDYSRIGLFGGALATSLYGRFLRHPPLPMGRLLLLSSFAGFTGASIGTGFQIRAGIQAVNSLENPERFKKALAEMAQEVVAQRRAALGRPPGARMDIQTSQEGEHTKLADGWDNSTSQQRTPPVPINPASDSGTSADRWSQLRSQKPTAQPAMWDSIRQTHERRPEANKQDDVNDNESDADRERRKAQAEFDALLEKERGYGQDNARELKSRWS